MAFRTLEQWRTIIEAQKTSGLNVADYCQQNDINKKTFYNRRLKLGLNDEAEPQSAFIRAEPVRMEPLPTLALTVGAAPAGYSGRRQPPVDCQLTQGDRLMNMFFDVSEVYLHREPVDLRKSIDGLMIIAEQQMRISPFTGALFVFCNRARDKLKILYWDKTGFAVWYKRLEKHRFKWPTKMTQSTIELTEQQLHWLLDGYSVVGHEPLHYQASGL